MYEYERDDWVYEQSISVHSELSYVSCTYVKSLSFLSYISLLQQLCLQFNLIAFQFKQCIVLVGENRVF